MHLLSTCAVWHTLIIVVGGIQWVKRSYNRARTCNSRAGDRSARISSAVNAIRASQSGGGIGVLSDTFSLMVRAIRFRKHQTVTRRGRRRIIPLRVDCLEHKQCPT